MLFVTVITQASPKQPVFTQCDLGVKWTELTAVHSTSNTAHF